MFTPEGLSKELGSITVQDGVSLLQLVRRLVKAGVIEEQELAGIGALRSRLTASIEAACGINYDVAFAQSFLAQPPQANGGRPHDPINSLLNKTL